MVHTQALFSPVHFFPLPEQKPIKQKYLLGNKTVKILFLTSNELKKIEYKDFLEKTYGAQLSFLPSREEMTDSLAKTILAEANPSPRYIIREETTLINATNMMPLSGKEVMAFPEKAPPLLYNKASLKVWIPKWDKDDLFIGFEFKKYVHSIQGYIDPDLANKQNDKVIGWDHLFVNAKTGFTFLDQTNQSLGKTSARQLVLADFVTEHLFYKKPQALTHHAISPTQAIEFTLEMSVGKFFEKNPFLSNPHIHEWELLKIRERLLNEGIFFKAGTSRPVKNNFCVPVSGIPLTGKKSGLEETIFMTHDLFHHIVPESFYDGVDLPEKNLSIVYMAWRMLSEALTLVMADMFYADTLVKSKKENENLVDQRIYPLFKALDLPLVTEKNRQEIMTKVLFANAMYAVLGDDSEWKKLLKKGEEGKLEAYKNHFGKFFIGDHDWGCQNFSNMSSDKGTYLDWNHRIGKELFKRAGLLLVSDLYRTLNKRGADLSSLKEVTLHAFQAIIEMRFFPKEGKQIPCKEEERLSRGFLRYMIGQMSFYSKYRHVPGIASRAKQLREKLNLAFFDEPARKKIYRQYLDDVRFLWGNGLITTSTASNFMHLHPIFPPVYIHYNRQKYKTIKEATCELYSEKTH